MPYKLTSKISLILSIFVILIQVSACVYSFQVRPLSEAEIQEVLKKIGSPPITVNTIDNRMTAILYRDNIGVRCYLGSRTYRSESNTRLFSGDYKVIGSIPDTSVNLLYQWTLEHDVICLTINDKDLVQKSKSVRVIFPDKREQIVTLDGREGYIFYQKSDTFSSEAKPILIFYDQDGKEIGNITLR